METNKKLTVEYMVGGVISVGDDCAELSEDVGDMAGGTPQLSLLPSELPSGARAPPPGNIP